MKENTATKDSSNLIEEMFSAGAHIGFSRSRRHPSVRSFIFGTKNKTEIINLEKTSIQLEEAKLAAQALGMAKKKLLFVGTKNEGKNIIKKAAMSLDVPYVENRWVGGTFTNFNEIKKRIERLEKLMDEREKGALQKYTKKERLLIDREIEDLERNFGGLIGMKELPNAIFVLDARNESIAVKEAFEAKISVISLSSSDCDISNISYPIVANDTSVPSIEFFVSQVSSAYKEGLEKAPIKEEISGENAKQAQNAK